jgi:uncharacterized repeat protein (TIGR01451 family)
MAGSTMQDAMEATVRKVWRLAAVVAATVVAFAAMASGASAAPACSPATLQVCVDVASTPATVSPSTRLSPTELSPTFASYGVSVVNQATRTVTHVTLADTLPAGTTFVSATPTTGTCAAAAGGVSCAFGSVPADGRVTATIVVQAPETEVKVQVTNTATVRFDEGFNDSPAADPKQDTVTATADTTVDPGLGAAVSLVPSEVQVRLDTDPTHAVGGATPKDPTIGKALVPASIHDPITATLDEDPTPFSCPKKLICRSGAWVHAEIPGTFLAPDELQFELHWSKVLVSKKQTLDNLAVIHTACPVGCPLEVASARCSPADKPANLPCLSNVGESATELRATLHSKKNGYMR